MTRRFFLALPAALAACLAARPARAMSFDKSQIRCATCHYWTATRQVYAQTRVTVPVGERGRCDNPESLYRNLWVGPLHVCPQYSRWDQLDSFRDGTEPSSPERSLQ